MKLLTTLLAAFCFAALLPACAGQAANASVCDMPYAPVHIGARWVYSMASQIPTMNGTITTSILSASATSFVMQTVTSLHGVKPATVIRTTVACSNSAHDRGMLRPKSGVTIAFNSKNSFSFTNVAGTMIPPENHWVTGYSWVYVTTSKAKGYGPHANISGTVTTRMHYQVQAPVSISVPFGHFTAIPITSITLASEDMKINKLPITGNSMMPTTTYYYVKGIGMVKSVSPMVISELRSYTP